MATGEFDSLETVPHKQDDISEWIASLRRLRSFSPTKTASLANSRIPRQDPDNDDVTVPMPLVEQEYIQNLQEQIYYLELEAAYMRQQNSKAGDIEPLMLKESQRMTTKIQALEKLVLGLSNELKRKEAHLALVSSERERLVQRLELLQQKHVSEKDRSSDEVAKLRKERDDVERRIQRLNVELDQVNSDIKSATQKLAVLVQKIGELRKEYERVFDESSGVEREVAYKRTELGALEARRQAAEERYMSSLQPGEVLSVGTDKLKNELAQLRESLALVERATGEAQAQRSALGAQITGLVREDEDLRASLSQLELDADRLQNAQLNRIDLSRRALDSFDAILQERRKRQRDLELELAALESELRSQKEKCLLLEQQVSKMGANSTDELQRSLTTSSSRLSSTSAKRPSAESSSLVGVSTNQRVPARVGGRIAEELSETLRKLRRDAVDLKRDRALLAEHVAALAAQAAGRPTLDGTGRSLRTLTLSSTTSTQTGSKASRNPSSAAARRSNPQLTRSLKRSTFTSTSK